MYVLDYLNNPASKRSSAGGVAFEYRLICSGELYNSKVVTVDWRKSDATRLLVGKPFRLAVCSRPFDDYPQELSLRFRTFEIAESKGNSHFTFIPDKEIARDIADILTLLLRRLITVAAKVRVVYPKQFYPRNQIKLRQYFPSDIAIDFVNRLSRVCWEKKPASVLYGVKGVEDIVDYNPPPRGVAPEDMTKLLSRIGSSRSAESIVLSARLYAQALRQIESETQLAYQLLISSVETMANDVLRDYRPERTDMIDSEKMVFKMAKEFGLEQDKAEELALTACSNNPWSVRKFTKFLIDNAGQDIWEKDDLFHLDELFWPKKEDLERTIKSIYSVRSGATHHGQPYPPAIALGVGPYLSAEASRDLNLTGLPNTAITRIPPIVWFERLANLAINNFIKATGTKNVS
jgi:hypothetical protein